MSNRLLILDDNEALLGVLVPLLEMNGYVVRARALAGHSARALLSDSFDILIFNHDCDLRAGAPVSTEVAARRTGTPPAIVAFSSSTEEITLDALRALGVRVLAKPLDFDRLLASIRLAHTAPAGCQVS